MDLGRANFVAGAAAALGRIHKLAHAEAKNKNGGALPIDLIRRVAFDPFA